MIIPFEQHDFIPHLNVLPLKALIKELTENRAAVQANLDMYSYASDNNKRDLMPSQVTHECTTNMCLVGRLPLLGFPALESEDWEDYSSRVVGTIDSEVWQYIFSAFWDDDVDQALVRLNDVVAGRVTTLPFIPDSCGMKIKFYNEYITSLRS